MIINMIIIYIVIGGWGGIADGYYKYANSMGLFDFDTTHGADWGGNGSTSIYKFSENLIMFYYIY